MSPRLAIVVLVLLVVLFVVALGSGACRGQGGQGDAKAGPLGALLGGALVKPLDPDTVAFSPSSCRAGQQVVVAPGKTCRLTVPKAGPATRRLAVVRGSLSVKFTPADPTFGGSTTATIPNGDTSSVDVVSSGGVLDLTCRTPVFCVLQPSS
jgi:hypothetical protein